MPSGVKIKGAFISRLLVCVSWDQIFAMTRVFRNAKTTFVDKDTYFGHILETILK